MPRAVRGGGVCPVGVYIHTYIHIMCVFLRAQNTIHISGNINTHTHTYDDAFMENVSAKCFAMCARAAQIDAYRKPEQRFGGPKTQNDPRVVGRAG